MYCIAHHILSPLANGSEANFQAIRDGKTVLQTYTDHFPSVEPFCASLFETHRSFTELCISSASQAIEAAHIDKNINTPKQAVSIKTAIMMLTILSFIISS